MPLRKIFFLVKVLRYLEMLQNLEIWVDLPCYLERNKKKIRPLSKSLLLPILPVGTNVHVHFGQPTLQCNTAFAYKLANG